MSGRTSRVRVFFRSTWVEGDVEVHMAARLKDEFDRSDRMFLMLTNTDGTQLDPGDDVRRTGVNVGRIVCVGAPEGAALSLVSSGQWGTRFEYDVVLRCDGFDIAGRGHLSIGVSIADWVSSRETPFLALTNATITPWRGEAQEFPIVFVARHAIETVWWRDDPLARG